MVRIRALIVLVLLPVAGCGQTTDEPPLADKPALAEKPPLLERWLATAASDVQQPELVEEVRMNRGVIESQFIEAFKRGPTPDNLNALDESVERQWQLMQEQLANPEVYGLDSDDSQEIRSLSLQTEKQQARHRFIHNYKVAALRGLAVTQGADAKAFLAEVAANKSSLFWSLAANALKSE
jgi:hypothetical protein